MKMAYSEVEMSSRQILLSPHERCIRGDNNKKNNNNNVRNIHVALEKNLNVFVRDHLENVASDLDDSNKASNKSSVSDPCLESDNDPSVHSPGQLERHPSRKDIKAASSLVQIWEARTTQQPSSPSLNQPQIDSRTSSSGSNVLENPESELIQPIEEENNEEEEEEEEMECDPQAPPPPPPVESGEKEREGVVRVMDIIRKLSSDSETAIHNENGSGNIDISKEVHTTEVRCFPQVTCAPRIRGRQAFEDLLVMMMRDREKELASLLSKHCVSKFTHRGRIQSTLRIRCYERCIAIQDRHRYRCSSAASAATRAPSSSVASRGRLLEKDRHKVAEKKVLQETMEKVDLKEVVSAVEIAKKDVLSGTEENKNGLKKPARQTIQKETCGGRGEKQEVKEKVVVKESLEKREMKEKAIGKESVEGNGSRGITEKVNLWKSEKVKFLMEEATRRIINVDSAGRSITTSKEAKAQCEKKKEDCVSVETNSKQADGCLRKPAPEEKISQEATKNELKKPVEKENREGRGERRETEESVEENSLMGIAEKVNLWNSKEKKNRRSAIEKGKGKGKADAKASTVASEVLQEASRRISNVETAERSITSSKEMVEKVVGDPKMTDKRETTPCESKEIIEVKSMNSQEVVPAEESASHGSLEKAKEINSSQRGEEMSILQTAEAKFSKEIDRNKIQETIIEEVSISEGSKEKSSSQQQEADDQNAIQESDDEETKKGEDVKKKAIEFVNDWDENEMEEDEEEYGDYYDYNGDYSYDWFNDISRPRSYWEDLRKERYLEVLNTEKKDICNLIESRTVSNFLNGALRQKIDNLMISRVQNHIGVQVSQKEDDDEEEEEEEEWIDDEKCSSRNDETEEEAEKTNLEDVSDGCSHSSARSVPLMTSWSFRDQDIDKVNEPTTSLSVPETSLPTNQSSQEMQTISDLREQMEKLQREVLELRHTVKSCVDMQLHFQKFVTQDLSCSGSSEETKRDPLKRKCCVCLEMPVDSLLYRCGHMCTCLKCAHELQWSSKKCPICMAPIVDVVRAFLDS